MRFIKIDAENKVVSIRFGKHILEGEIESEAGEIGQIMQLDGSFVDPEPESVEPQTSIEDKINFIYYKQMGVI